MFGNQITQLLGAMADAVDDLAVSETGDKLAAGLAAFTKKVFDQLHAQGFSREEAVQLTCAMLTKGNSS